MPQMAPAWWTILFFTFILSFMIMFFLLYFQYDPLGLQKGNNNSAKH